MKLHLNPITPIPLSSPLSSSFPSSPSLSQNIAAASPALLQPQANAVNQNFIKVQNCDSEKKTNENTSSTNTIDQVIDEAKIILDHFLKNDINDTSNDLDMIEQIKYMFSEKDISLNALGSSGNNILHQFCIDRDLNKIAFLLKADANVNQLNAHNESAIHLLLKKNIYSIEEQDKVKKCIKYLFENGWRPSTSPFCCTSPLHLVCDRNQPELLELLLDLGLSPNVRDNNGNTPLHYATRQKGNSLAKILIKKNANIEAKNHKDETPLHIAAGKEGYFSGFFTSNSSPVFTLIDAGARKDVQNKSRLTPAMVAKKCGRDLLAEELILDY